MNFSYSGTASEGAGISSIGGNGDEEGGGGSSVQFWQVP
jgi:hypothetical protein